MPAWIPCGLEGSEGSRPRPPAAGHRPQPPHPHPPTRPHRTPPPPPRPTAAGSPKPHSMEPPQNEGPAPELQRDKPLGPLENVARTADFWRRTCVIYAGYKACQAQALALRALGWDEARLKEEHWARQHSKAAQQMYSLCVDLRGFYLKVQMCAAQPTAAAAAPLHPLPAAGGPQLELADWLPFHPNNKPHPPPLPAERAVHWGPWRFCA